MMPSVHRRLPVFAPPVRALAGALGILLALAPARADQVKVRTLWIPDVLVRDIDDGKLLYETSLGAEVGVELPEVEAIALDRYRAMKEAHEALEAKEYRAALGKLTEVLQAAREPWLKTWVTALLVQTHDALQDPARASEAYLQLVEAGADPHFLARPPLRSIQQAPAEQKSRIHGQVQAALASARDDTATESLKKMLNLSTVAAAPGAGEAMGEAADGAPGTTPAPSVDISVPGEVPEKSAIPVPKSFREDLQDPVAQLVWKGQFQEALEKAEQLLAGPTRRLSFYLYLKALAQLGLADAKDDQNLYKDAGLSFMRVVMYFPKSPWVGSSLLEAGYVHQKIGRIEIAQKLYADARNEIDEEEDPDLAAHLEKRVQGLEQGRGGE